MGNHHGIGIGDFRAFTSGAATQAVCLAQSLLLQGMVAKAERDLDIRHHPERKQEAFKLACERNRRLAD